MKAKAILKLLSEHSPQILTGLAIGGYFFAGVWAVKDTPKFEKAIADRKEELGVEKLPPQDILMAALPTYGPAVGMFTLATLAVITGMKEQTRRNTVMAAAYTISETALKNYREKVVETIGEDKETDIRERLAVDKMTEAGATEANIPVTDHFHGRYTLRCWEPLARKTFYSDRETIRRAMNNVNKQMRNDISITLNEWLDAIGCDRLDEAIGDKLGWDIDRGDIDISFGSCLDSDGIPCLALDYVIPPHYLDLY